MFRPLEASTAFGATFAKPRKPLLKPSFAKEPPSQTTRKPTRK